jgi:uncharacterized RDD family membrane protein YckC
MSAWVVPPVKPGIQLPPGLGVAGMGRRIVAYIVDFIIIVVLGAIAVAVALISGAVSLNQAALDQVDNSMYTTQPFAHVTEPLIKMQMGLVIAIAVAYVAIQALYFVWSWTAAGGSPGQRMMSLRVADLGNGGKLSLVQAGTRWLVLYGIAAAISTWGIVVVVDAMSRVPANEYLSTSYYARSINSEWEAVSAVSGLTSWAGIIWAVVLLIAAGVGRDHRGIHDKVSGTIMIEKIKLFEGQPQWGYMPAAGAPGYPYPPQGMPTQGMPPQYPAQYPPQAGQPYGGAWSMQEAGYPPQAPGWPAQPPAAPGYPPQAPGWPAQPPVAPPAAPQPEPPTEGTSEPK